MELNKIRGEIVKCLDSVNLMSKNQVAYVKAGIHRDVVTQIDLEVHNLMKDFCSEVLPGTVFISEEEGIDRLTWRDLVTSNSSMIVDPLDGSNNLVCGLKEFGFMACMLANGRFTESLVVLPNESQVVSWDKESKLTFTNTFQVQYSATASTYLAYSPRLSPKALEARSEIFELLDAHSAGIYRYGSACIGLYRTLIGQHSTFIGIDMRPWDVVSFLPILVEGGLKVAYSASQKEVTIVASWNDDIFSMSKSLLANFFGDFQVFHNSDALVVTR